MCASSPLRPHLRRSPGFSLVELLVAVVLVSLLMAGMFNIFKSTASNFQTSIETLGMQRNARWGLTMLQDEVLNAGFLLPPRVLPQISVDPAAQPPVYMGPTDYTPDGATEAVDEVQFIMDLPLNIQGTLTDDVEAFKDTIPVNIPSGASLIQAGDIMFIQDSASAFLVVESASATSVKFKTSTSSAGGFVDAYGDETSQGGLIDFKLYNAHKKGATVTFIRPLQVVRYTVVPRKLDPSDPDAVVPCLVRQMRPLVGNAGEIWAPPSGTPQAIEQIILEGVTGFKVDWSLDGGKTWIIKSGASGGKWNETRAYIDQTIKDSTNPFVRQSKGVADPSDPFWPNYLPVLMRIDVETRSRIKRTEYNPTDPTASAYRTRRETLMLSPRNFALGRP
jgi:prepilin-type N-terminal cleavage/methylation domain-containing protein